MINADSEKRRKTFIRVHLSTSSEAERSVVIAVRIAGPSCVAHTYDWILLVAMYQVQVLCIVQYSEYAYNVLVVGSTVL